jgi:hypothetical protein
MLNKPKKRCMSNLNYGLRFNYYWFSLNPQELTQFKRFKSKSICVEECWDHGQLTLLRVKRSKWKKKD